MVDPREAQDVTEHPLANYPRPPPRGEDLPYDDGEPMETGRHRDQMYLLIYSLSGNGPKDREFYVSGNMFVYFSETQARNNDFRGPDVFVVLDAAPHNRKSWVAWEEDGKLPDVVIELLSPSTEHVDRGEKMRIYREVMGVQRYYLYDPFTYALEGYALTDGAYERLEPNAEGRLECAPLGLELGLAPTVYVATDADMLRWFHPDGRLVPTDHELRLASEADLEASRSHAEAATARAEEEKARAEEEKARAEEEKARAEEEKARAEEEKARADALARRVAELEAKLSSDP